MVDWAVLGLWLDWILKVFSDLNGSVSGEKTWRSVGVDHLPI